MKRTRKFQKNPISRADQLNPRASKKIASTSLLLLIWKSTIRNPLTHPSHPFSNPWITHTRARTRWGFSREVLRTSLVLSQVLKRRKEVHSIHKVRQTTIKSAKVAHTFLISKMRAFTPCLMSSIDCSLMLQVRGNKGIKIFAQQRFQKIQKIG